MSDTIVTALLRALDDDALDELAERLAPRIEARLGRAAKPDAWLDSTAAAAYLGLSRHALHRLTSDRAIPCSQDRPGGRLYFRACDLDSWRLSGSR